MTDPFLEIVENLSRFHREHEKFYAERPLHDAVELHQASRAMKALAERWTTVSADPAPLPSPYAGAADLNDDRATETIGVLFMEGEGEPAEITRMKTDLRTLAATYETTGAWLTDAMQAAWGVAEALLGYPALDDLLAERHRIISNDAQAAAVSTIAARSVARAVVILDRVEFTPAALRADLSGARRAPALLFSAAELLDHAADLIAQATTLTHENERRWRVFHERVARISV